MRGDGFDLTHCLSVKVFDEVGHGNLVFATKNLDIGNHIRKVFQKAFKSLLGDGVAMPTTLGAVSDNEQSLRRKTPGPELLRKELII